MKKYIGSIIVGLVELILSPFLLWHDWPFILHKKGKYNRAIKSYKKRIGSQSKNEEYRGIIYFNIGLIYKISNNYLEARKFFLRAKANGCKFNPNDYGGDKPVEIEYQ